MTELFPCPCGGKAALLRDCDRYLEHYYQHRIVCSECGIQTSKYTANEDDGIPTKMIETWNNLTRAPSKQDIVDAVTKVKKDCGYASESGKLAYESGVDMSIAAIEELFSSSNS